MKSILQGDQSAAQLGLQQQHKETCSNLVCFLWKVVELSREYEEVERTRKS